MTGMPGLIHTHDKVVDSRILKGQLSNSNYSVKTVEQGGFPVYDVTYIGDRYIATATNVLVRTNARVAPEVVDRRDLHPGESYRVDAHVFHQAEVTEAELTCTLVRMHSQSLGVIKVLGLDGYPAQIDFLRRQRSGADVVNLAEI